MSKILPPLPLPSFSSISLCPPKAKCSATSPLAFTTRWQGIFPLTCLQIELYCCFSNGSTGISQSSTYKTIHNHSRVRREQKNHIRKLICNIYQFYQPKSFLCRNFKMVLEYTTKYSSHHFCTSQKSQHRYR